MVRRFDNSTTLDINTVVSDSNRLAVTYNPRREYSTGSVRMTYSMLENGRFLCRHDALINIHCDGRFPLRKISIGSRGPNWNKIESAHGLSVPIFCSSLNL